MSQQATKPFLHHKRVPCLSFTHCWAFWWSLLSNIHSSLSKRRIFGYKGTYFLAKSTLLNKKTNFIHASFSLCLAKTGRNSFWNCEIEGLFASLRLLERDEWILLNKDHQYALKWANKKQGTLLWCKKGLVACWDITWEPFFYVADVWQREDKTIHFASEQKQNHFLPRTDNPSTFCGCGHRIIIRYQRTRRAIRLFKCL